MIYLLKPTEKLTVDIGWPCVGLITYDDDSVLKFAASNEPVSPAAIAYADNWMEGENSVFFSNNGRLSRSNSEPAELLTFVTVTDTSITFFGIPKGIKSIQLNAVVFDFTLSSLDEVRLESGRTILTEGFPLEDDAFNNPGASNLSLLEGLEIAKLTIKHDDNLWVMEGRANREQIAFLVEEEDNSLPQIDGELNLSDPRFSHFEVIGGNGSKVSSLNDERMINGTKMRPRLGDMTLTNAATLEMTFVAYVHGDTLGVVLTASLQVPLAKASVLRRRDIVS